MGAPGGGVKIAAASVYRPEGKCYPQFGKAFAMKKAVASLPLHYGSAPRWLFERMVALGREILRVLVYDFGPEEVLRRLADPFWFQALGCLLGFDWHSSGLTTTVCGALKEATKGLEGELGIFVAGGKGRAALRTPEELARLGDRFSVEADPLIRMSRLVAKVDNCALQDGYTLYHHTFIFTRSGLWCVIQQGMNPENRYARRYHWLSEGLEDPCREPHKAVCCDQRVKALNLVAEESEGARRAIAELASQDPETVLREVRPLECLDLPQRHDLTPDDLSPEKIRGILLKTYSEAPKDFQGVLLTPGIGPKALRALSLLSELLYGEPPSFRDPARFGFAHGGKDGRPYPVDRELYDRTIEVLKECLWAAKVGYTEKLKALRRLNSLYTRA